MLHNLFNTLQEFKMASGKTGKLYSLPALEKALGAKVSRLPVSIRVVLESVLRNCDGKKITEDHVRHLANWKPNATRTDEIPFVLSRILLQDLTGIPSLADLAAMRSVAQRLGKDPKVVEPLVPVDLVVDHSIQIDHYGVKDALDLNMKLEFKRNQERYTFMKWAMQAFDTSSISRAVCTRRTASTTPTPWSAPTATHPWSTPSAWSRGAWAASKPRPACSASRPTSSLPTWSACI